MKKIKMAIVSSYSESCGNASFTKVLSESIQLYCENIQIEIIRLNLTLLQSIDHFIRRKADKHIQKICIQLKEFDLVNIQVEAGLYGTIPSDIVNRLKKLISSNSNTSITLHSPRILKSNASNSRAAIKKLVQLKLRSGLDELFPSFSQSVHIRINRKIIKSAIKKNIRLIVHTNRAREQIDILFSYKKISVHPLKFIKDDFSSDPLKLETMKLHSSLGSDDILIGIFGYISAYKGHVDALNALKLLPANFKLLVFGRQHPQTIKSGTEIDIYLSRIKKVYSSKSIKYRVFFMGELNDSDFMDIVSSVDIAWLPYYENGQDGSGIASICMDLCPRVLCSTSFAFDELFKLVKYNNIQRFDIGNIMEIATKTQQALAAPAPERPFCDNNLYSLKTQAFLYVDQ